MNQATMDSEGLMVPSRTGTTGKGLKKSIHLHCSRCQVCAKHNIKTQQLRNEHFSSPPQPMEFIVVYLIGEFHPASSKGNKYALTAI